MAYIYLEELKEILPDILDQWIDEDDESWEWIFQEIEQKCYVGTRLSGKGEKSKDKEKWKNKITKDVADLTEEVNKLTKSIEELNNYAVMNLSSRINALSHDIVAAKSMAETAKQRTEVNYNQISKTKNDADVIQDVYNRMAGRGATREELDSFRDLIHKYDALEKKEIPISYCKPEDKDCKTCKYYCGEEAIDEPCIACDAYQCWEKKEEPIKSCTNCKYHVNKNGIYDCTCFDGVCGPDNKNWEAKDE